MTGCLVLVIACTGFASQGWVLLSSFDGRPAETAGEGLRTLAIVAAALAIVAVIDGFIGNSRWSAGIIAAHAALTLVHPNLWLLSALPAIVALLMLALGRLGSIRSLKSPLKVD